LIYLWFIKEAVCNLFYTAFKDRMMNKRGIGNDV